MRNGKAELPQVLKLNEAARFIRVSEKTLGEMARQTRVPCQKAGREWRFLRPALEEWLRGSEKATGSAVPGTFEETAQDHLPWKQGNLFGETGFRDTAFTQNREEPLHRWVPWIAGFSSSFVDGVFDHFISNPAAKVTVLDPFAGVGTTLVEGLKRGYNVVGFEINPFAALACRVKVESLSFDRPLFRKRIQQFSQFMAKHNSNSGQPESSPPQGFTSRSPFFSPAIKRQVLFVLDFVKIQAEPWIKDLFRLAFGSVMVGVSNYSYEPSLGRRAAAGKADVLQADVAGIMVTKLGEMLDDMGILQKQIGILKQHPTAIVHHESYLAPRPALARRSIDLLITSPPYLNNYHYLRNTRPQLYWLDMVQSPQDLKQMEHESFGKFWQTVRSGPRIDLDFDYTELNKLLDQLRQENPDRGVYGGFGWANYAAAYFNDCDRFLRVTHRLIKPGGSVIIVIGNNILQGIEFKTDELLARLAERHGFEVVNLHRVRTKRTGSSIVNSSVRVGGASQKAELYETAVELRVPD